MIQFVDYWQAETAPFEGAGALRDAAQQNLPTASKTAIARLFVLHALAAGVGSGRQLAVDGLTAASYLAALFAVEDPEAAALAKCLGALRSKDTAGLAATLHEAARVSAVRAAPGSARELAELSYEAALEVGSWQDAYFAARILERLAILDECPPAAECWGNRAELHLRRVRRALGHV
jgi:hypothetical protein